MPRRTCGGCPRRRVHAYRLPSEAEWEYAARAGTHTPRYWDAAAGSCGHANGAEASCADGYVWTSPVGTFAGNGFGLHDVLGNAGEWVQDCWREGYEDTPAGRQGPASPGTAAGAYCAAAPGATVRRDCAPPAGTGRLPRCAAALWASGFFGCLLREVLLPVPRGPGWAPGWFCRVCASARHGGLYGSVG